MKKIFEINLGSFIIRNKKRMDMHKFSIIFDKSYIYLFLKLSILKYLIWTITIIDIYFAVTESIKYILVPIGISFLLIYILIKYMNKIYLIIEEKEKEADTILEQIFFVMFDIKDIRVNDVLYMLNDIVLNNLNKISTLSKEEITLYLKTEIFKNAGLLNDNK